jgi:phosphate starvation-inducible protein PhoH and related proteins
MARGKTETIEFDNVDLVRELSGPGHANLALIEQAFDVYLEAPGSSVVINGNAKARARAVGVIKEIYGRLENGWPCTRSDVEALILGQINGMGEGNFAKSDISQVIPVPRRKPIVPKTKHQGDFITAMRENTITFGVGPAGTGKTFLATAYGASLLARGEVGKFIACRPAVEAGEKLGFLPGDLMEKIDPYLQPIYDALTMVLGADEVERRKAAGEIEVAPLAFMRGRTLSNAFVVIDEAQNATVAQMKMALTRLGEDAAYAVTGDPSQSDLPHGQQSGLSHALTILGDIEDISMIEFDADDVVRHPLVGKIVKAYAKDNKKSDAKN